MMDVDRAAIFVPQHPLPEFVLRGTIMYLLIFVTLRIVLRRQVGGIGTSDVLVIVLISEVSGNGTSPSEQSVVEGGILVATILFWSYAIEWLHYRSPAFERPMRAPRLKLIENGRLLRRNMRKELVTLDELMAQVRENGLEDCAEVKAAYMEANGYISIIKAER